MKSISNIISEFDKFLYLNKSNILMSLINFKADSVILKDLGILIRLSENKLYVYFLGFLNNPVFIIDINFILLLGYFGEDYPSDMNQLISDSRKLIYNLVIANNPPFSKLNENIMSLITELSNEKNMELIESLRESIRKELGITISRTIVESINDINFY